MATDAFLSIARPQRQASGAKIMASAQWWQANRNVQQLCAVMEQTARRRYRVQNSMKPAHEQQGWHQSRTEQSRKAKLWVSGATGGYGVASGHELSGEQSWRKQEQAKLRVLSACEEGCSRNCMPNPQLKSGLAVGHRSRQIVIEPRAHCGRDSSTPIIHVRLRRRSGQVDTDDTRARHSCKAESRMQVTAIDVMSAKETSGWTTSSSKCWTHSTMSLPSELLNGSRRCSRHVSIRDREGTCLDSETSNCVGNWAAFSSGGVIVGSGGWAAEAGVAAGSRRKGELVDGWVTVDEKIALDDGSAGDDGDATTEDGATVMEGGTGTRDCFM